MLSTTDSAAWANGSLLRRRIDDFSFEARVVDRGDPERTGKLAKIMFVDDGRTEFGVLVSECESLGSALSVISPQTLPPAAASVSPGALLLRRRTEFGAHLRPSLSPTDTATNSSAADDDDDDTKNEEGTPSAATPPAVQSRFANSYGVPLLEESTNIQPWFQRSVASTADAAFTRWASRFGAKASRSSAAPYSAAAIARRNQTSQGGGSGGSSKDGSYEASIPGGFLSAELDDWRGRYQEVLSSERIAAEGIDVEGAITQGSKIYSEDEASSSSSDGNRETSEKSELDCVVAASMLEHSLWASPGSWYSSKLALRPHSLSDYHQHFFKATPLVANAAVNVPILRRRPPPSKLRRAPGATGSGGNSISSSRASGGMSRGSSLSVSNVIASRNRSSQDASDDDLAAWHWAAAASAAQDLVAMGWHPNTRVSHVNATGAGSTAGGSSGGGNSNCSSSSSCSESGKAGAGANTPMAKASQAAVQRHEAILCATFAILATCLAQQSRRDSRKNLSNGARNNNGSLECSGADDGQPNKSSNEKRQKTSGKKGEKSPKKLSAQELVAAAVRFGVPTKRIGGGYSVAYQDRARVQAMIWQEAAAKKSNAKAAALQKKVAAVMLLQKAVRRWANHRAQNRHWSLQDGSDSNGGADGGSGRGSGGGNDSNGAATVLSQASLDAAAVRSALAGGAFGRKSNSRKIGQSQPSSHGDSNDDPTPVLAVLTLFGCVEFINVALPALLSFCPGGINSAAAPARDVSAAAAAADTATDKTSTSTQRSKDLNEFKMQPTPPSPFVGHVLTVLDLRGCCFGLKSSAVEAIAMYAPNLHVLDLSGPGPDAEVGDADLLLLAHLAATSLRCLQLCCWQKLTSNGLIAFTEAAGAFLAKAGTQSSSNSSDVGDVVQRHSNSPVGSSKRSNDAKSSDKNDNTTVCGGGALADKPPLELPPLATLTAATSSFGTITLTQPASSSNAPNLPQIKPISPSTIAVQPSSGHASSPLSSSPSKALASPEVLPLKPRLQGLNLTEAGGVADEAVGAILKVFGDNLVDLCMHGTRSLTGAWLRHLDPRHALRRLNYAGNYKMTDDSFLPLWHRARPEAVLYSNPNAFYFEVE